MATAASETRMWSKDNPSDMNRRCVLALAPTAEVRRHTLDKEYRKGQGQQTCYAIFAEGKPISFYGNGRGSSSEAAAWSDALFRLEYRRRLALFAVGMTVVPIAGEINLFDGLATVSRIEADEIYVMVDGREVYVSAHTVEPAA